MPTIGDPNPVLTDPNAMLITHDVEGIYWVIKDVIGIHYETKDTEIKVCLRLAETDVVCEILDPSSPQAKLTGNIWIAKASVDFVLNPETRCLTFNGTICVRAIWKNMQWLCLPNVKGTVLCWN